jgi:hypothetical protein
MQEPIFCSRFFLINISYQYINIDLYGNNYQERFRLKNVLINNSILIKEFNIEMKVSY